MHIEDTAKGIEQAQAKLRQLEQELEHSQRLASLGMILGIIAHEFNNILTPVLSYSQLALDNPDDKELATKALRRAADGADKAARIASSVLALAKKDGYLGQERESCTIADVSACFTEALQCLAMDRPGPLMITQDVPHGTLAAIDPVALQQVFVNLLLNARKSFGGRQGRISIRCAPGDPVAIEVEDSGSGMRSEVLGSIFDPFTTGAGVGAAGTGLGLAICRRLIEEAGGAISATSAVGQGSCFRISLPGRSHAQNAA